jgi:leucyl aminopeptidase
MKIVKKNAYRPHRATVVIPVFKGAPLTELWRNSRAGISRPPEKIKGEISETLACHSLEQTGSFLLVGAGRPEPPGDARRLAWDHGPARPPRRPGRCSTSAPLPYPPAYLRNLVDYLHLNNYRFDRYRKKGQARRAHRAGLQNASPGAAGMAGASDRAGGNGAARDLVNEISAKAGPTHGAGSAPAFAAMA